MKMKKIVTWGLAMGLMASSLFGTSIYAASAGSRKINDTYGTIRGEIEGGKMPEVNAYQCHNQHVWNFFAIQMFLLRYIYPLNICTPQFQPLISEQLSWKL